MTIRPIQSNDIPTIVSLHRACLPDTISSRIGHTYLSLLYNGLLKHSQHVLLLVEDKEQILGVVTATSDLSFTSTALTRYMYPQALPVLAKALLTGRINFFDLIQQFRFEKALVQSFEKPYATILTLFIAPDYQGKGIGKKLVEAVKKECKKMNILKLYVDTLVTNKNAQKFYGKVDAKPVVVLYGNQVYQFS